MSTRTVRVPDIGEGIAEVEIVAWHVAPGDEVDEDQILAEVMTDKATVEIPSPVAGRISTLHAQVGDTIAVGSDLIGIEAAGLASSRPQRQAVEDKPPAPGDRTSGQVALSATRIDPAPTREDATPPRGTAAPGRLDQSQSLPDRPLASPAVRRRARELGLALDGISGSGPGGRIVHGDLDRLCAIGGSGAQPTGDGVTTVPLVGLRRRIAQRMQDANRRIAHFSYVEEVDVSALESLRAEMNRRFEVQRGRLRLLPFLVLAITDSLTEFPQMNARFDDEAGVVSRFRAVHVGIATHAPMGLMVPVLRNAQQRDIWSIAAEIARLADAARTGHATRDELSGSTITVTSLGALGGIASTPVINAPEVAIVGVNRIVERPAILQGAVVARKMMNLSSSFDHRVVDGMDAAAFIQAIRARLEQPALLFVR